ncbi:hypothetical protein TpMuguga_04g00084 [Theileria parva strain Muguga]|uniref:Uncharacterized protein n=1 Tax=Theileria parva TaxID=5875 RepID=Q4N3A3_THEPA|nr:uncharacterized protein TpMuguga_04g00084 [Theileria parva strain Muguga]EAN31436.1 hypothetical protein TpMuguga_04g00084 [Theileria parva strain Muguga]|eukprot:XP_763719.1 hypothetical protein [Theileria parva strain Muguga]
MYQQVIQFGYPQFLAIMRNGKPFVIRKNGLHEQWYSVTHLRYDIAKLLFTDLDDRDYNYLQCDVELYELIVVFTFGFKCRKVWFDGRLCWTMPSNAKEFPKYLAFHLRYNQMYLMFSKLRMERLDLENPHVSAVVERPVSVKRRAQNDKGTVNKAKKVCNRKLITPKTSIEPSIEMVDGGSTSLNMPRQTELLRLENTEEISENCSIPQEKTLESSNLPNERVRIEVLGKRQRTILKLFQENWHKIILCNGYNSTSNGNNYRYKLEKKLLSKKFRRNCARELIESIDFYKEQKIIVFGTETKFTVYKLENGNWTEEHYVIPPIKLLRRDGFRNFVKLTSDQYTVHLVIIAGILFFVYRVIEGVECMMVKFRFETLVNFDIRRKNFIKTLVYSLTDDNMLVETNLLIKCTKVNNGWISKTQKPWYLRHYAAGMGGLIPVYMDRVKITEKSRNIYRIDYQNEPNSWERIDIIKYREKIIWKREPGQPFPKNLTQYSKDGRNKLTFQFEDKFIRYIMIGNRSTEEHYPIPPIRLLNEEEGNSRELSSEDYSIQFCSFKHPKFVYTLKNGVCTLVKYGERVIYNGNPGEKPLHVFYTIDSGRIEIVFEDKILFTNSRSPNYIVKTFIIPPELTLYKRNDQGEAVKLNAPEYIIQIRNTTGLKYTPSNDVSCTELRHNGTVVWRYTDGPQPVSFIYYFKKIIRISVRYPYKPSLHYNLENGQWTLTNP